MESDAGLYTCCLIRDNTKNDSVMLSVQGKLIHIYLYIALYFIVLQLIQFLYMAALLYMKTKQHYVTMTYFLTAQLTLLTETQHGNLDQTIFPCIQAIQINMQKIVLD